MVLVVLVAVCCALYENSYREQLQVVAINELADIDTIAICCVMTARMGVLRAR